MTPSEIKLATSRLVAQCLLKPPLPNITEMRQVGTALLHASGRTDRTLDRERSMDGEEAKRSFSRLRGLEKEVNAAVSAVPALI